MKLAFLFKKLAAYTLYPLSLCLITLLIGLFFIWFTRKQRIGKIIVSIGVGVLLIFSLGFVSTTLLGSLESEYAPLTDFQGLDGIKWIVVLGGGHSSDPKLPANGRLSDSSLARLVEGIRIHHNLKDSKLILSGGAVFDPVPEAKTMADAALLLGINGADILLEADSKDTEDQARNISRLSIVYRTQKLILVTSASHMPRSVILFRKYGLDPIPAPADFSVKQRTNLNPRSFFPSASALQNMERVFHEYLGMLWSKLKPKDS